MRHIVVLLLVLGSLFANTEKALYDELTKLTQQQKYIMYESYILGAEHDLGYTLAAIAWKESKFGLWIINLADGKHGSFGVYHILLESAMFRNGVSDSSSWYKSRLAEKLMIDLNFAANEALSELLYWKKKWSRLDRVWSRTVASYNRGNASINSNSGREYAKDILLRTKVIKKYFEKNKIAFK